MTFQDNLIKGKQVTPPRIAIYGTHGIGKSTFASKFSKPIFISTEDGLAGLDVISFPRAEHISDVRQNIGILAKEPHDFKTLVIDSVDWLVEPLIVGDIEKRFDEKERGYGKGAVMIAEAFREILEGLDVLRKKRNMSIVLIAHASILRYDDPRTEPYDRYQPKLPNRCNALMQEWVDILAFAAFRVLIKKTDVGFNNTVSRGITTGERLLHFIETPAFVAKNRYNCPEDIELSYEEFKKVVPVIE